MKNLRIIRTSLAILSIVAITLLFVDVTDCTHNFIGWLAKLQFVPAVLAINLIAVIAVILLTLIFGRIYCSVICPLGILQDVFNRLRGLVKIGKKKKNRFIYQKEKRITRIAFLILFIIALAYPLTHWAASLIEPYSTYGRIVSATAAPAYDAANNVLAGISEANDDYTFSRIDTQIFPWIEIIGIISLAVIAVSAFFFGRAWCNNICPVGTLLGFVSRFSIFKIVIDTDKCNKCTKCMRNCKCTCIDAPNHKIDYSRCVVCFDCIDNCSTGAISYRLRLLNSDVRTTDTSRRNAIIAGGVILGTIATKAADEKLTDGGLAPIIGKEKVERDTPLVPAGSVSSKHLSDHCTACQLCIQNCPNQVLRPSTDLKTFLQPVMGYEKGYCRPECTLCSELCPVGAIKPITPEEKTDISIGTASVNVYMCLMVKGTSCGNCARHCPAGAITLTPMFDKEDSPIMPVVNESRCIGCGACENLCPVSPISAITVNGREVHTTIS